MFRNLLALLSQVNPLLHIGLRFLDLRLFSYAIFNVLYSASYADNKIAD